ncbi:sulfurtransferase complex subunit TusD [Saccharospirillum salsuginis]|uniref:Sulfurtransferase TusD n=1 Tax=Saccharospirillum salsuginis TaxID=418750 RepID=A0A918N9A4_9GAMM|nr:sulfurtransferase complex subunit TusD [Saccharospirillum salsuginis]GGX53008.1 sulfurtransferase TusD [Saccharospirillum salsuginis]
MNLQLNIYAAPWSQSSQEDALAYARAARAQGLCIKRVFFFMDGVYAGLTAQSPASDEIDIREEWVELHKRSGCELLLCIAASANRGLLNESEAQRQAKSSVTVAPPFELVGLGQWTLGFGDCDKVVSFR